MDLPITIIQRENYILFQFKEKNETCDSQKRMMEKTMHRQKWEKGWLDEILNQADQAVQSWPEWMREPELRYPLNRHSISQNESLQITETRNSIVGRIR